MIIDHAINNAQQLKNGYFQSGSGPTEILILGTCLTIPYVTYLAEWNSGAGNNQLTIRRIDPGDWTRSKIPLASLENDSRILSVLRSSSIFIHEHFANFGMFNTTPSGIYRFGMEPETEISVPGWHNHRILENDWADFGADVPGDYLAQGKATIEKFYDRCAMSSFPEFVDVFRDTWRATRYFWRPNYVSAAFTKAIFWMMNSKFLHLPIDRISEFDLLGEPHRQITRATQRDRSGYGLTW